MVLLYFVFNLISLNFGITVVTSLAEFDKYKQEYEMIVLIYIPNIFIDYAFIKLIL